MEWFCLRTQNKREHVAAAILNNLDNVEVFCPRISQIRKTRNGKKRFVDALFPGYLFARFNFSSASRWVLHTQGVTGIVHQGERKAISDKIVSQLREAFPDPITEAPDPSLEPGATVEVVCGSLQGLQGKVLATLPAENRIQILLEFLGREIKVAVSSETVLISEPK